MIKRKIKEKKQLNHVILTSMLVADNQKLCFAQKILAKYGMSRWIGHFPELIFRQYHNLFTETAGAKATGTEDLGRSEVIKRVVDRLNIYHYITNGTGKTNRVLYSGNTEHTSVLNSSRLEVIKRFVNHLNTYNHTTNVTGKTNQVLYSGNTEHTSVLNMSRLEVIKRLVNHLNTYNHTTNVTGETNQVLYSGNTEHTSVLNMSRLEVIKRLVNHLNTYNHTNNVTGKTNQVLYSGNTEHTSVLNMSRLEVIKRLVSHLNTYNHTTNVTGKTNQVLYSGNTEHASVPNSSRLEVIKRLANHLNTYNHTTNVTGKTNQVLYSGNTEHASVLNSSRLEVIKRLVNHLNTYNHTTNVTGKTNQVLYSGNTEHTSVLNLSRLEVIKRLAHRLNIYNYATNVTDKTSQAYAPALFDTTNSWMSNVQKKYHNHVTQRKLWNNISYFVTEQRGRNKASQPNGIFHLEREAMGRPQHRTQQHNNPIVPGISGLISGTGLLERSSSQEKTTLSRNWLPNIQYSRFIHNIQNMNHNTLLNIFPEVSSGYQDVKPTLRNTAEKTSIYQAESITKRDYIEQRGDLLKPLEAKIRSNVSTVYNQHKKLQNFSMERPDSKLKSSLNKSIIGGSSPQGTLIIKSSMVTTRQDGRTARASSPASYTEKVELTGNHKENMPHSGLIFSKHIINEAYDVEAVRLSKQSTKQGKEVNPTALSFPEQLNGIADLTLASFGKSRMDYTSPQIILPEKSSVAAAIMNSRAIRQLRYVSNEMEEQQKYIPGNRIKLHFNNEARLETHSKVTLNQNEISDLTRYNEAVQRGRLIFHKPIIREAAAARAEVVSKRTLPDEKKADTPTVTTRKQLPNIHDIGSEEINLLAERVFKVLEKRIAIQKDRRGLL